MLIGPYVNGSAVIIGGLIGAVAGGKLPERVKTALPMTFGLCSVGLGITLVLKVKYMPAVVLAMIVGALIGELLHLERGIGKAAGSTRGLINKVFPPVQGLSHEEFTEKFVAILVLFCASGTGVFGAMTEGMSGDPSILYIKTILDLFTAGIFATLLGFAVMTIAIPQLVIQLALAMLAVFLMPMITPSMMADFSCTGGLLMVATGLRICNIKLFPVANMLPGLVLVMPFSHLWATLVA
ncbi:membrane protein [Klebsiella sp. STW0522-44]|nr:membrane protein [Klebsiella sp. STW0522-44]